MILTKNILLRKIGKTLFISLSVIVVFLLLICSSLLIPAVQTFAGKQATAFLSKKMNTEISIDKLRIGFDGAIIVKNLKICDLHKNNLIFAKHAQLDFPIFKSRYLELNHIFVDSADVSFRTYLGENDFNLRFFIDFFKNDKPKKDKMVVNFNYLKLTNSRFQLCNENTMQENEENIWNYNNMIINNINTKIKQMLIIGDSLNFWIEQLQACERSGFCVDDFHGHLQLSQTGLYCFDTKLHTENQSQINVDFGFDFSNGYQSFKDFFNAVSFNTTIHHSELNTKDLTYFVKTFSGMNNNIALESSVRGCLADIKFYNTIIELSQNTFFNGKVGLSGLPNIEETFIDLTVNELNAKQEDLLSFNLPQGKNIQLPQKLKLFQWANLKGHFIGLYNNFFADAKIYTNMGNASCEVMFNSQKHPMTYDGKINTKHLALGTLLGTDKIGTISLSSNVVGKGIKIEDMNTHLDGFISEIEINEEKIKGIDLKGNILAQKFEGQIACQDSILQFNFNGFIDFNNEEPQYDFDAQIAQINLSRLKLFRPDSNAILNANIIANMSGRTLDSLKGNLTMNEIYYSENEKNYPISDFVLNIDLIDGEKHIVLQSDMANADIKGQFEYANIFPAWKHLLHSQLPAIIPDSDSSYLQKLGKQFFNCQVDIKNISPILQLFTPSFALENGAKFSTIFNENNQEMNLSIDINKLKIKEQSFDKIRIYSYQNRNNPLFVNIDCDSYKTKSSDKMADFNDFLIKTAIFNDSIRYFAVTKGNDSNKIEDIFVQGLIGFKSLKELFVIIDNGSILWNNEAFLLDTFNYVQISPNGWNVKNFGIHSANDTKSLQANSTINERNEQVLSFKFNEIELGMANIILNRFGVSLQGKATGSGGFLNFATGKDFAVGSNFFVEDFEFNDVSLGYLEMKTAWVNELKKLFISTDLYWGKNMTGNKLMSLNGYFNPKDRYIDLEGNIEDFNIKVLEPFLSSFANKVEGLGTGYATFSGPINDPKLLGEVSVYGVLGIDFLKTEYLLNKAVITFVDTGFIFDNVEAFDIYNNKAIINGMVTHQKLKNWGVNLRVKATNLMALNTSLKDNNLFYGKAFVSGNVSLKSEPFGIQINADVSTEPRTDINLLFDWSTTANENNFITFVSENKENQTFTDRLKENLNNNNIAVNLKIKANQNANVRVFLDPSIGGTIYGKGNGNIELNIDRNNNFTIYGPYVLNSGTFDLAYGDILTRSFKLQNGGTLSWSGDPMRGKINLKAIQTTKVSINNLLSNGDESSKYKPISVNNILTLSGDLLSPYFSFSFDLPDADESVKNIVYNSIDTTDRDEMVKQMVNVLFLGSFESTNANSASGTINSGLGYSISELISHQLNKVVSSLSENIDVRVAYRNNEDATEKEYSMDLGGSFLNDRLSIRTTFGIYNQQDIETNDKFLGDINVEYKITPDGSLKVKAFNITNQQEKLEYTSKYSQGLGLSYSKSFDTYKELFSKKRRRKEKPQK